MRDMFKESQTSLREASSDSYALLSDRIDALTTIINNPTASPSNPGFLSGPQTGTTSIPHNVLSRWPWVKEATVESIANGKFDLNNLPELHREEEFRNRHIAKTTEGYRIPLDGSGKPELITGRTKMHSAFRDFQTFLSAWYIYISIRISYEPERGPGLLIWTERLNYRIQMEFPWPTVLNYIIAYFQLHQKSPPEQWQKADAELVGDYFVINPRKLQAAQQAVSTSASSKGKGVVCQNWNRPFGCTTKEKTGLNCTC